MRYNYFVLLLAVLFLSLPLQSKDYYVSPKGSDNAPGTIRKPWKTLEKAFSVIREDTSDVRVIVGDGDYQVTSPMVLSGIRSRKIVLEAAQGASPVFRGDRELTGFRRTRDRSVLSRLDPGVRGKVLECDLSSLGIKDYGEACRKENLSELYWNGERQRLARYPDEGFVRAGEVLGTTPKDDVSSVEGVFSFPSDRLRGWAAEVDPWVYGYFRWDWSEEYQKVGTIDPDEGSITLESPWHHYGYKSGFKFAGVNLLCELDSPGEYYIDRMKGRLYWYPPQDFSREGEVSFSVFGSEYMMEISDCENIAIKGIAYEGGRRNALLVRGSSNVSIDGVRVSRFGGDALHIQRSHDVKVGNCLLEKLGHGGIRARGGDRKTLEKAGYVVTNTLVRDFSQFKHTYEPGLSFGGCGMVISHCEFCGCPSSAVNLGGNDIILEYNHFHDLVTESDDQGAIDTYYNYSYRGVVIRYNLWENITGGSLHGSAGVRLDDMISGYVVYGNVFRNVGGVHFGGVQIHGGKDNIVDNNVFYQCNLAVSFSPWDQEKWEIALAEEGTRKNLYEDVDIDGQLYRERYPELSGDIHSGLNRNIVRNNLAIGCKGMFYRENGNNILQNNSGLYIGEDPFPGKPLEYYLSPEVLAKFGLQPIPFKEIGRTRPSDD